MHYFQQRAGELYAEDVPVSKLVQLYKTPLYIYSAATLKRHFEAFDSAFNNIKHLTCFSAKANSNLSILNLLGQMGAGVDIVSGGELYRSICAGISAQKIVYSGVGKTDQEIEQGLDADILMFNVESRQELERIQIIAKQKNQSARISLRINPDVDPKTHPYISTGLKKNKFGIAINKALEIYKLAQSMPNIQPVGIDCHIGSQLTQIEPFLEALNRLKKFYHQLQDMGIDIKYLDLGGGLGITYNEEEPPHPSELGKALTKALEGYDLTLVLEPGRVIAGNAGIMVTKSLYTKETEIKSFVIVDAAMNDLLRPSLYGSFHRIGEVVPQNRAAKLQDIVGPICESSDFLAQDRLLPQINPDELLAVFSAGAYGFSMASQYNARPRAAEIMVSGSKIQVIRRRETYEDLISLEK